MKWRALNTGINDAAMNMAIDEAILLSHAAGDAPPTVRFYGWQPAAVSLGYFQRANSEIDLEECRLRGIDVVRRLTGGRAVLHDAELTYSVVVREDYPGLPSTITASYRYFSSGLLAGLKKLGIDAQMNVPKAAYGQTKKIHSSSACFDAPAHYEITAEGRKLVGSAQVRKEGVILQHGSLLLRFCGEQVAAILRLDDPGLRKQMASMLASRAISLEEILGREVSWQEAYHASLLAMSLALGIELETGDLSDQEVALSQKLASEKYRQDSWNLLR